MTTQRGVIQLGAGIGKCILSQKKYGGIVWTAVRG